MFRGEPLCHDSRSPRALFEVCNQTLESIAEEVKNSRASIAAFIQFTSVFPLFSFPSPDECALTDHFQHCSTSQVGGGESKLMGSLRGTALQQDLYIAVSAASSWLDAAENQLLSGPVLLSEDTETQLANIEVAHNCHAAI